MPNQNNDNSVLSAPSILDFGPFLSAESTPPEKNLLLLYLPSLPAFFSMPKDNYLNENVS